MSRRLVHTPSHDDNGQLLIMLRSAPDARKQVFAWWARACTTITGRNGGTALRICAAFAMAAMGAGKVRLDESYREIAERAGVSVGTVAKYLSSKPDYQHMSSLLRPFVSIVRRGDRVRGSRSTFQLSGAHPETSRRLDQRGPEGLFPDARILSDQSADHWHRNANGWRLWCLLDLADGLSAIGLAEITGLHPGTVRRILNRLSDDGLARRLDGLWYRVDPDAACLEELRASVDSPAQLRRERHRWDRANRRRWLHTRHTKKRRAPDRSKSPTVQPRTGPTEVSPATRYPAALAGLQAHRPASTHIEPRTSAASNDCVSQHPPDEQTEHTPRSAMTTKGLTSDAH